MKPKEIKPITNIIDEQPEEPINTPAPIPTPIIFDPNEKLKELITLNEQPCIINELDLIEIHNIKNIEKLLQSDLLQ